MGETKYIVWSSIERVREDSDSYEDVGGTMRKLAEFDTLEEAEAWQVPFARSVLDVTRRCVPVNVKGDNNIGRTHDN